MQVRYCCVLNVCAQHAANAWAGKLDLLLQLGLFLQTTHASMVSGVNSTDVLKAEQLQQPTSH